MKNIYELKNTDELLSPSLIYYIDIIRENIEKAIAGAGSAQRLWPHVKSHKCAEMIRLQLSFGIDKFKAATIAEAEMCAAAGAKKVILAYPLVGPNIGRFIALAKAYPDTVFYAIGDDEKQLAAASDASVRENFRMNVLIDANMGMNRTGIELDGLESLYRSAAKMPGLKICGMHCYDGNHNNSDFGIRNAEVKETDARIEAIVESLKSDGIPCGIMVAGGTPSFPCHAQDTDWYLSPGTAFLTDAGYQQKLPDLTFVPGAALFTRVVSHPAQGLFTIDLGYKGIAADPAGQRGYIVGMEDAEPVLHSEEHWVFRAKDGASVPEIGAGLYVIPTHICPTSALYPEILVAKNGEIIDRWTVTARNRKINY